MPLLAGLVHGGQRRDPAHRARQQHSRCPRDAPWRRARTSWHPTAPTGASCCAVTAPAAAPSPGYQVCGGDTAAWRARWVVKGHNRSREQRWTGHTRAAASHPSVHDHTDLDRPGPCAAVLLGYRQAQQSPISARFSVPGGAGSAQRSPAIRRRTSASQRLAKQVSDRPVGALLGGEDRCHGIRPPGPRAGSRTGCEEFPGDVGLRRDAARPWNARHHVHLARHTGGPQLRGVVEVLVVEQVQAASADPGGRQPGQVGAPCRYRPNPGSAQPNQDPPPNRLLVHNRCPGAGERCSNRCGRRNRIRSTHAWNTGCARCVSAGQTPPPARPRRWRRRWAIRSASTPGRPASQRGSCSVASSEWRGVNLRGQATEATVMPSVLTNRRFAAESSCAAVSSTWPRRRGSTAGPGSRPIPPQL